jgi:cysteine desulfurase
MMIYLDYASNYPSKEEVLDTFIKVEKEYYGNYNSLHLLGASSKEKYNEVNKEILNVLKLDTSKYEIVYTSGASESNNLAIKGVVESYSSFGKKILVSELEHNSINATLGYLKEKGYIIEFIKTLNNGKIDLDDLKSKLNKEVILVCVCLVNSETGAIQDYKSIASIVSDYSNCHLLMDATQAMGKLEIDYNEIELVSFSSHKFGGIIGSGGLIKRKSTILTPLIHGGSSDSIYRSGTVALSLIASTSKALTLAYANLETRYNYVLSLANYLKEELIKIKGCKINSFDNPYIINLSLDNIEGNKVVKYLSDNEIYVSQKSACSITNTPSKTIMAIYKDKKRAMSSFRISLSELTTKKDLEIFLDKLRSYVYGKI